MTTVDTLNKNNTGLNTKLPEVSVGPEGLFSSQKISAALDKFVERGDITEDLILRSDFPTYDHGIAWCRLLYKAKHFNDKQLEAMLMNYLAMLPAIKGKRIDILKQAVIGQISNSNNNNSFWDKLKKSFSSNKEANE